MRVVHHPKPIPAVIGILFGGLWAVIAAMALPSDWRLAVTMIAALATAILIFPLLAIKPHIACSEAHLFSKRTYQSAVVVELIAIYAASAVLPRFGWQYYFSQVVGIIVGLHFIGLWAATRSKRFLGIAGGICIISAIAIPLPATFHLLNMRDVFTGFGNAFVLWLGASRPS